MAPDERGATNREENWISWLEWLLPGTSYLAGCDSLLVTSGVRSQSEARKGNDSAQLILAATSRGARAALLNTQTLYTMVQGASCF
ncbi:hypothetical protein Pcinc_035907 [Petrolisthes cinctipes]|uniref:Uncharacterized protein n=1 Tax=Petrolisthes cinctipes TaxID=88211 RepID=A0AAE1BZX7_PETCI|nr:hypothetical protein Pcinc_035907 [Petrolisthes cinctipes]